MIAHRRAGALWRACLVLTGVLAIAGVPKSVRADGETKPAPPILVSDTLRAEELIAQGIEHAGASRDSQALQYFQRAWRWDPTRNDALLPIPQLAAKLDRLDTAARYALIIVRGNDTQAVLSDPALYRRLANHAAEQSEHALAAELWEALYDQTDPLTGSPSLRQKLALEVGKLWFLSGDSTEASDWFHRVAENPLEEIFSQEGVKLWEAFVSCHLKAERFDRVEQALTRLAEEPGGAERVAYWQAHLALERHQPAVALEKINECLATEYVGPSGFAYEILAQALRATNQANRIAEELQRLHDNRPDDPVVWLAWIDQLAATGKESQALGETEQLVKTTLAALESEEMTAWNNTVLAHVADRQIKLLGSMNKVDQLWPLLTKLAAWWGSIEPVRESLEQTLSSDPFAELAGVWLATRQPDKMSSDELVIAGRVAILLDRADDSARFYQPLITRTVARDAKHTEETPTAIHWLHAWLDDLLNIEAWPQVIEAIEWSQKTEVPQADSADMLYWLTFGYMYTEQNEKALATIRLARQLTPDDLSYTEIEATLLVDLDRLDEAIAVAQVGLSHSQKSHPEPDEVTRLMQRMLSLWLDERAGPADIEPADELLETVLDSWPLDSLANNDLAYRWAERGVHLDRSLRMAQMAVAATPDSDSCADTLGWVLFRLGRHEEAVQELRRAIDLLSPEKETAEFAVLYEHLAAALQATGDDAGAEEANTRAKQLRE